MATSLFERLWSRTIHAAFSRSGHNASAQIPFDTRGIIDGSIALEAIVSLMRRRLVRKFGSIIGLLAILMTTLAPAVSQALVSNARANAIFSAHCSAITEFQTPVADHPPAHPSIADHRDACGYCNFAAHSAAAPPSINTLPERITAAAIPVDAAPQPIAPFAPSFAAQPRAPPFSA